MTQRITEKAVEEAAAALCADAKGAGIDACSRDCACWDLARIALTAALPHLQHGAEGGWKAVATRVEKDAEQLGLSLTRQQKRRLANIKSVKSIVRRALSPASAQGVECEWQPIETAPKDGSPILAWCDHEADLYIESEETSRLTLYGAHAEGMGHAPTGFHIVLWGGGFDDRSYEDPNGAHLPDWWFVAGSEFETAANPTRWMPLPPAPLPSQERTTETQELTRS